MKQKKFFQVIKSLQLSMLLMASLLSLQMIPTITVRANQAQAHLQPGFPNSALSGDPNDPPSSDGWLTVGHAKEDSLVSSSIQGCPIFPANNIWNTPVDNLPIHARSSQWINTIGRNTGFHMDFGSGTWDGGPIGIPYNIVDGSTPKVPVSFYYANESDAGPYPIPANPVIEYGSDHHLLLLEHSTCTLYEIYKASYSAGMWYGGSGAIWALSSNALRPDTWTSADAAGLPILPGLVRYDEIVSGEINHAIRFTASQTNGYIWPARHLTTDDPSSPQIPPMGARFRLKASYNISGYPAEMRVILQAMKKYGIILADNGSNWYVSGAPDERWDNDMLHLLDDLTGDDFEAVDVSSLMVDPDSGEVHPPGLPGATWIGSVSIASDQNVVAVGRPHLGSEVASYIGSAAGSTTQYVPMLFKAAFGGTYNAALYIQNVSASAATLTLDFTDSSGTVVYTKADTLDPHASKGYWLPAEVDLPNDFAGGVKVTSTQPILVVGRPHIGEQVMTYNGMSSGATTSWLPMFFKNGFGSYNTALYIQNLTASSADLTIDYINLDGTVACTYEDTLGANASKGYWSLSIACDSGSLPSGFVGGVKVTSSQNILAVGRAHLGAQITTYNGFPGGATSAYVPMLFRNAFAGGSYNAALYMQNVSGSSADVTVEYVDNNGTVAATQEVTLAANAISSIWLPGVVGLPDGFAGGARISSTQDIIAVGRPHLGSEITAYNGAPAGSLNAYLPMLFNNAYGSYNAAFYIQNTSASAANVEISFYDSAGVLSCIKSIDLAAGATEGFWMPTVICEP